VLMRAYAGSSDQTRPTIVLHGLELAISPAGLDPHGSWGVHVEPPVDGRAQDLRAQLELAAKRLAGSKGNPPRLMDEAPRFDDKATNQWAPGTSPDVAPGSAPPPAHSASQPAQRQVQPSPPAQPARSTNRFVAVPAAPVASVGRSTQGGGWGPRPALAIGSSTRPGFLPDEDDPAPASGRFALASVGRSPSRSSVPPAVAAPVSFAKLVGHTMPLGLSLTDAERDVLNALGRADLLTASEIGSVARVADPVAWMEELLGKLGELGLELVIPGPSRGSEPSYRLRR